MNFLKHLNQVFFCCLLVIILLFSATVSAQLQTCPRSELNLDSIRRIEWDEQDKDSIQVMIGSYYGSPYLSTWLKWNITTHELTETTLEGASEAIQLATDLNFTHDFFSSIDRTYLEVNTALSKAIYIDPNFEAMLVDLDTDISTPLGSVMSGARLDVLWYSDSEFILVIEPPYGPGYPIWHFCTDKTCPEYVSNLTETLPGRPALNVERGQLALIDELHRGSVKIYDLESQSFVLNKDVDFLLASGVAPIWSAEGESIYLLGFHNDIADYVIYQFDLDTDKLTEIGAIDGVWDWVRDWLVVPEKEMVVFLTSQVQVDCY